MALIAALALSVSLFTFCTQTVETEKGEAEVINTDDILREFQAVGLLHNKVMAEVIEDFSEYDKRFLERGEYFSFLEQSLLRNLSKKSFLSSVEQDEILKYVRELLTVIENEEVDYHASKSDFGDLVSSSLYIMSPGLQSLLQQVDEVLNTASSDAEIVKELKKITNSPIVDNLPADDKHILFATTSVGIESTLYWEDNLDYWIHTLTEYDLSDFETIQFFNFNGRSIIRRDIDGALVGAIGGCMTGALAGGIGCGPGAATGALIGSATSSAGEALSQILDSFL